MRTALMRGLAAIVALWTVAGCGPQPKAYAPPTPEELRQLTDVTDKVMLLVRNPDDETALRGAIAAVDASIDLYRQHSAAISNLENAHATSCIHAHAINTLDLETLLARRAEAARRKDEDTASRRSTMLRLEAMEIWKCAIESTNALIDREQRQDALQHAALLISEIYAVAAIARTAADLPVARVLEDQIRTYEKIAAKLGPEHQSQVIADALPKLQATLAHLGG